MRFALDLMIATVAAIVMLIAAMGFIVYYSLHWIFTGKEPDMGRMFDI